MVSLILIILRITIRGKCCDGVLYKAFNEILDNFLLTVSLKILIHYHV